MTLDARVLPELISDDIPFDEQLARLQRRIDAADKPVAEVMLITPELARHFTDSEENHLPNRDSRHDKIAKFAAAMSDNDWCLNGETVVFELGTANGGKGRLLDGWHRFRASVRSKRSFVTLVAFGVPASAFKFMDIGTARTPGDVFKNGEVKNPGMMANATRWIKIYSGRNRYDRTFRWQPNEALTFYTEKVDRDRVQALVPLVRDIARASSKMLPKAQLLAFLYMLKPDVVDAFAARLLKRRPSDDGPVLYKWLENRMQLGRINETVRTLALDTALKAMQRREKLTHRALSH